MIIVTGGAGFIGSNLVAGLNKAGYDRIKIVDDLTDGSKHRNLNRLNFSDYVDYKEFYSNIDKFNPRVVFHQGACSNTMEADGSYMMDINYNMSVKLFKRCAVLQTPFIYASSASVYGDGSGGFREEESCEYPLNVYAFSKFQFDRFVRKHSVINQVVGLRYYNVYGPQENHKGGMASVIYHFYSEIVKNPDSPVIKLFEGSENFKRDFIHVDDVVRVNLHMLDNPTISGIYNCGTGKAASFLDLAKIVKDKFPMVNIEYIPMPEKLIGKYQSYTQADLTKLRSETGYKYDFMDISSGVKKYLDVLLGSEGYIK